MRELWQFLQRSPAPVRMVTFLLGVVVLAAPIALPLYRLEYAATAGKQVVATPISLFLVLCLTLPTWLRRVHCVKHPWQRLGLVGGRLWWQSWAIAFALGIFGVSVLYGLQLILGWGSWNSPSLTKALYFLLEGTLVGFGVGLAEELIFRAWLLFELETDYSPPVALGINALIFAIAHYFRPLSAIAETWPQAVGLFLLGMTLVWARRIPLRLPHHPLPITVLGFPAGLHGGLVWAYYQVDVNDLIVIDPHIPAWLTGIGGNPLAGVLGLALLSGITAIAYRASHSHLLQETH